MSDAKSLISVRCQVVDVRGGFVEPSSSQRRLHSNVGTALLSKYGAETGFDHPQQNRRPLTDEEELLRFSRPIGRHDASRRTANHSRRNQRYHGARTWGGASMAD